MLFDAFCQLAESNLRLDHLDRNSANALVGGRVGDTLENGSVRCVAIDACTELFDGPFGVFNKDVVAAFFFFQDVIQLFICQVPAWLGVRSLSTEDGQQFDHQVTRSMQAAYRSLPDADVMGESLFVLLLKAGIGSDILTNLGVGQTAVNYALDLIMVVQQFGVARRNLSGRLRHLWITEVLSDHVLVVRVKMVIVLVELIA